MAWKYVCWECGKLFKGVKGRGFHKRQTGHVAESLGRDVEEMVAGMTRPEAADAMFI